MLSLRYPYILMLLSCCGCEPAVEPGLRETADPPDPPDPRSRVEHVAGTGESGASPEGTPAHLAQLNLPADVVVGDDGTLYVADAVNHRVVSFGQGGLRVVLGKSLGITETGPMPGSAVYPFHISWGTTGKLLVAVTGIHHVVELDLQAGYVRRIAGRFHPDCYGGPEFNLKYCGGFWLEHSLALGAGLRRPASVVQGTDGVVYIREGGNISRVDDPGEPRSVIERALPPGFWFEESDSAYNVSPGHMAFHDGKLYVCDVLSQTVRTVHGGIVEVVAGIEGAEPPYPDVDGDGGLATDARLSYPRDVDFDSHGNMYILEWNRIRRVTPDGIISTFAGDASGPPLVGVEPIVDLSLVGALGIFVDRYDYVYVADAQGHRVLRIRPL